MLPGCWPPCAQMHSTPFLIPVSVLVPPDQVLVLNAFTVVPKHCQAGLALQQLVDEVDDVLLGHGLDHLHIRPPADPES